MTDTKHIIKRIARTFRSAGRAAAAGAGGTPGRRDLDRLGISAVAFEAINHN